MSVRSTSTDSKTIRCSKPKKIRKKYLGFMYVQNEKCNINSSIDKVNKLGWIRSPERSLNQARVREGKYMKAI